LRTKNNSSALEASILLPLSKTQWNPPRSKAAIAPWKQAFCCLRLELDA